MEIEFKNIIKKKEKKEKKKNHIVTMDVTEYNTIRYKCCQFHIYSFFGF